MSEPETITDPRAEYDSPWKEVTEYFFGSLLHLGLRQGHDAIDWDRGIEFLDKELQQILPDSETGRQIVDKLAKVWLKSGEEVWVLIHVEVQAQRRGEFPERFYLYNCALYLHFRRSVVSLAILADDDPNWKPDHFSYEMWGCKPGIQFPVLKLLDFENRWDELEASDNPFAIVIMAHLKALATRRNPESRFTWRLGLVRLLYQKGYDRDKVYQLLRFIDWVMALPEDFKERLEQEMEQIESRQPSPFIPSFERKALHKGTVERGRKDVLEVLQIRFQTAPAEVAEWIEQIDDAEVLSQLHRKAVTSQSLEEFRHALA